MKRDFILDNTKIDSLIGRVTQAIGDNIRSNYHQVHVFAEMQRESMEEFEAESFSWVTVGQRFILHQSAGYSVPGGGFAHIFSALMSTISLSSPDAFMALGAVQAIGAMAFGLFTGKPVDIVVDPCNAFIVEAKRAHYGKIGIDLFAGPTEVLIIANRTAGPMFIAVYMTSHCNHGYYVEKEERNYDTS